MRKLKAQMIDLIVKLPVNIQHELSEELCLDGAQHEMPEKIAEELLECELMAHFYNDCTDMSGLSFRSVLAGILCDRIEEEWSYCMPVVIVWVTKKVLSDKQLDLIEKMIERYDLYYGSEMADEYRKSLRNKYVAECADDSYFMNFMKLIMAVLNEKSVIIDFLYKCMNFEQDKKEKKIYLEAINLLNLY